MKRSAERRTHRNAIRDVHHPDECDPSEREVRTDRLFVDTADEKRRRLRKPIQTTDRKGPYRFDPPHAAVRWPVVLPLIVVIVASVLIRVFDVDRLISSMSYDFERAYWPFERAEPWLGFYRYGLYPPIVLGLCGFLAVGTGRWIVPISDDKRPTMIRRQGLFLALMLLIGPGLLINAGLKSLWGRPRPLQCEDFGGPMGFKHVGDISTQKFPNSSFPSGHAATAFYFIGPAFLMNRRNSQLRRRWFLLGIAYGSAMGITRVLQGGHFVSDVLWAGLIVYLVGVVLCRFLLPQDGDDFESDPSTAQGMISVASTS